MSPRHPAVELAAPRVTLDPSVTFGSVAREGHDVAPEARAALEPPRHGAERGP